MDCQKCTGGQICYTTVKPDSVLCLSRVLYSEYTGCAIQYFSSSTVRYVLYPSVHLFSVFLPCIHCCCFFWVVIQTVGAASGPNEYCSIMCQGCVHTIGTDSVWVNTTAGTGGGAVVGSRPGALANGKQNNENKMKIPVTVS